MFVFVVTPLKQSLKISMQWGSPQSYGKKILLKNDFYVSQPVWPDESLKFRLNCSPTHFFVKLNT
jgi:hypothetical protein